MSARRRLLGSAALTGLAIAGLAAFAPAASAQGAGDDLPPLPEPWEWCQPAGVPGVPSLPGDGDSVPGVPSVPGGAEVAATDIPSGDLVPCIPGEKPEPAPTHPAPSPVEPSSQA